MLASRLLLSTLTVGCMLVSAGLPSVSFADEDPASQDPARSLPHQDQAQWVKKRLDREAAMLEIKASQEGAWEAYAASAQELAGSYGAYKLVPLDVDAAALMRLHADQAASFAQHIARLADATDRLRKVLNDDQRKVLDRIVRMHSQLQGRHHEHWQDFEESRHDSSATPGPAAPAPRTRAPAKTKN
ncbi:MAG: hypothetical protein JSS57_27280 [Proteobacteria bacterium]|nr:hypothetical protein [Pseudomonadota bacterium]